MDTQKPLAGTTSDLLINYILTHNLKPGDKLPNEYKLAEILEVGRSTVREAVKTLVSRNVLEVKQGSGTFISETSMGVTDDPLGLTFIKDKEKLALDLLEIRMALEPRIAALAAANATAEDVAELRALEQEVKALILADIDHTECDVAFHRKIAEASHNLVMPNLAPIIQQAISLFLVMTDRVLKTETIETHAALVDSIANHDQLGASDAMTLHLIYNRNNIRSHM
ncbi:MAG: GntR family transcriptional regulator [Clostridiales Family XIII bacterium]|nr:GntR family transcriptional regulator [Clostridiales Family XIII bacterium]